ncbi:hypothetical protein CANTEDRAFT_129620 [Yamadazyma tenuis ATCC 10573]|uniref:Leucine carboxyl methyltransferase 1 n=1 Tax=Candida tenuis (strain ATCC 10573 / BCRC 21748 / CBS 615 / JCM 9827 / NBRC 10315 / NRRL Y-1498 / VKM Y-70) TaxID=590646 RepID=G3B096_CANTC|nr:uncharacterized protein CANTEDRAFT_129620 [Yamadazyma tenuis ATCC 10573]EGV65350.1 hypothetical protein CANTEDRAFT_129620 [Yamadazyma tenuis ATCC 10573]
MLSPNQKKDKVIRSTDLDALACRLSCAQQGYFLPMDNNISKLVASYSKYLQFCEGYTNLSASRTFRMAFNDRKFPIINRGTYLRTQSISQIVEEFIKEFGTCQILSLGGGSDTRCFKYVSPNVKYLEIDFPETAKIKKLTILGDNGLRAIVKYEGEEHIGLDVTTRDQFNDIEPDLHTSNYHIIGYDLRKLTHSSEVLQFVDSSLPTLVLSECVLCYASPQENENIINIWSNYFGSTLMSLIVYDPISLKDAFGAQMADNLQRRGINLLTFNAFATVESKLEFFHQLGLKNSKVTDISSVGGYESTGAWFDEEEVKRISKLEIIDEVEEIKLLFSHYCLLYGENQSSRSFRAINNWRWKLESD